jgi:uncharacterized membrane protein SpoIIM required for sporulation
MFRFFVTLIHGIREALMAIFLATAAFLNLSPDSQASFFHRWMHWAFETTERWHVAVSAVSLVLFIASLSYAIWKTRAIFVSAFRAVWIDHKSRKSDQSEG